MEYNKKIEGRINGFIIVTYYYLLKNLNRYFHIWNRLLDKGRINLDSIVDIMYLDIW